MPSPTAPDFPAGPNPGPFSTSFTLADIAPAVASIRAAPARMREAVAGLDRARLDTRYRNWTVRQIVHHLGDAQANIYIRWKLALTEDSPTIKPYSEGAWSDLRTSKESDIAPALAMLEGVHGCWADLIGTLTVDDLRRTFFHPEMNERVRLVDTIRLYAWHADHHIGQIEWMRRAHGWS